MADSWLKAMLGKRTKSIVMSYKTLRQLIGWLGIVLPIALILGGWLLGKVAVQGSISSYYHTNMRDFFEGLMVLTGMFLITYSGRKVVDSVLTTITGIAGLCVALFPCQQGDDKFAPLGILQLDAWLSNGIHLVCAVSFFLLLAFNSLFLFTRFDKPATEGKAIRNVLYVICGIVILVSLVVMGLGEIFMSPAAFDASYIKLIFESIALWAFGVSWLVKGSTIGKGKKKA